MRGRLDDAPADRDAAVVGRVVRVAAAGGGGATVRGGAGATVRRRVGVVGEVIEDEVDAPLGASVDRMTTSLSCEERR